MLGHWDCRVFATKASESVSVSLSVCQTASNTLAWWGGETEINRLFLITTKRIYVDI